MVVYIEIFDILNHSRNKLFCRLNYFIINPTNSILQPLRPMSSFIGHIYRIVPTIRKCVVSQHTLAGGEVDVCGDEAAELGVIVPALEVVPTRFGIVDIPPITERVVKPDRVCQGARCGNQLAPTIVGILYNGTAASVNKRNDIVLRIPEVVVGGTTPPRLNHAMCSKGRPLGGSTFRLITCREQSIAVVTPRHLSGIFLKSLVGWENPTNCFLSP